MDKKEKEIEWFRKNILPDYVKYVEIKVATEMKDRMLKQKYNKTVSRPESM